MDFKCRHCGEDIERRESDDRPGTMEWVTKFGNDPQCDASPSDNHGPDTVRVNVKDVVADIRQQREGNEMKTVNATQLATGQYIVNVGQIVGTRPEGAFVFVSIEGEAWDATRGVQVPTFETRFLHASDEVVVVG